MSSPKVHPIGDRIAIKRAEAENETPGGIVLPDQAKETPKEGVVVAVGRGRVLKKGRLKEPEVKANDRVLFRSYAGTEVEIGGEEYIIMSEDDILAVLED